MANYDVELYPEKIKKKIPYTPRMTRYEEFFFPWKTKKKKASRFARLILKHNGAKCRCPTLKNQGAKMILVQSKLFPRVLQEPNTSLVPDIHIFRTT